jgi:hypothetical protein
MPFHFSKIKSNNHGGQVSGKEAMFETVHGWRIVRVKLERNCSGFSVRFILYFPSGACWYFDYYSPRPKDRRAETKEARQTVGQYPRG